MEEGKCSMGTKRTGERMGKAELAPAAAACCCDSGEGPSR